MKSLLCDIMKIQVLLFSLFLMTSFAGCVDKSYYLNSSSFCMGDDEYTDDDDDGYDDSHGVRETNCEGRENSIALAPGEYHIIDSGDYNEYPVTLFYQSDTATGVNHTAAINYFSLTETSYDDFVACEPFNPIEVYDEYGRFGGGTNFSHLALSFTNDRTLPPTDIHSAYSEEFNNITHNLEFSYGSEGHDSVYYDEEIYLVLDNWHCEDEKSDGSALGDVFVTYRIGIHDYSSLED